ncbi:hypothetical protein [Streptomyces sp. Z26]|uniref:hypothetical protein n=1 Tax=Streptomyces TaxID=1883 RepID=UPI000EF174B0|nr:hypothetical protein [Streptomyces sp. Z26]RLL69639.1 hypothetical protein D7M15_25645 [Streptomyces sp. Z26]
MTTHAFPADLVQAQRDWYATYRRLADSHGTQTAVLRRELLRLSVRITTHPYWTTLPDAPAARMELKQTAWGTPPDAPKLRRPDTAEDTGGVRRTGGTGG